jgi:hypothetical protein
MLFVGVWQRYHGSESHSSSSRGILVHLLFMMADCTHSICPWLGPCLHSKNLCLGIVYVPVSHLRFRSDIAREHDTRISKSLAEELKHDCRHDSCENAIEGYIGYKEVPMVLEKLRCTIEQLRETIYNKIRPVLSHVVTCVDGQHRAEAAKLAFGEDAVWTVRLISRPDTDLGDILADESVRETAGQHLYRAKYSDGEILRKVQESDQDQNFARSKRWIRQLGVQKRKNVEIVEDTMPYYQILRFPGQSNGVVLGVSHKQAALRCDEDIARCFDFIERSFRGFVLNIPELYKSMNLSTVGEVEGRAPSTSTRDRRYIEESFDGYRAFPHITNPELRAAVREELLGFDRVIPSLRIFHECMKYYSIAMKITQELLLPGPLRPKPANKRAHRPRQTLRATLLACWETPQFGVVEVEEGIFRRIAEPPSFDMAFATVVIAALRQFPYLSFDFRPRVDRGKDKIPCARDPSCVALYIRRAKLVGFSNPYIEQELGKAAGAFKPRCPGAVASGELPLQRRFGVPHSSTFRAIQSVSFLPQLLEHSKTNQASVGFMQANLVYMFMGSFSFTIPDNAPGIDISSRLPISCLSTDLNNTLVSDEPLVPRETDPPSTPPTLPAHSLYYTPTSPRLETPTLSGPPIARVSDTGVVSHTDSAPMAISRHSSAYRTSMRPSFPPQAFLPSMATSIMHLDTPTHPPSINNGTGEGAHGRKLTPAIAIATTINTTDQDEPVTPRPIHSKSTDSLPTPSQLAMDHFPFDRNNSAIRSSLHSTVAGGILTPAQFTTDFARNDYYIPLSTYSTTTDSIFTPAQFAINYRPINSPDDLVAPTPIGTDNIHTPARLGHTIPVRRVESIEDYSWTDSVSASSQVLIGTPEPGWQSSALVSRQCTSPSSYTSISLSSASDQCRSGVDDSQEFDPRVRHPRIVANYWRL